ncbi:hypothetical protein NT04LM_1124a, partial [Listeria monocytogenes FSL F2-208]
STFSSAVTGALKGPKSGIIKSRHIPILIPIFFISSILLLHYPLI